MNRTMSAAEQEHWDHEAGCASEFQNCLSEARINLASLNARESMKISEQLSLGRFVVVEEGTYYCRATDGIAGSLEFFHSAHTSREAAERAANKIGEDSQGEDNAYVLPRLPDPAPVFVAPEVDDCPF